MSKTTYQTAFDKFKRNYESYNARETFKNKYGWAATYIFNLATYDSHLDEMFVKLILEVCEVILENRNYDYIEDETNYFTFIAVCQRLDSLGWIDWGTSIRGAWFDDQVYDFELDKKEQMIICDIEPDIPVYPCKESIRALIDFVEEE